MWNHTQFQTLCCIYLQGAIRYLGLYTALFSLGFVVCYHSKKKHIAKLDSHQMFSRIRSEEEAGGVTWKPPDKKTFPRQEPTRQLHKWRRRIIGPLHLFHQLFYFIH